MSLPLFILLLVLLALLALVSYVDRLHAEMGKFLARAPEARASASARSGAKR